MVSTMAMVHDLRDLGYDIDVAGGSDGSQSPVVWRVQGFGMSQMVRCKADGTGWASEDQQALDSWSDPEAHTERKFRHEHADWAEARDELEEKGYFVKRTAPTADTFVVRADKVIRDSVRGEELPTLATTLPKPVSRLFEKERHVLPSVPVPDWSLISQIEALFRPYVLERGELEFHGMDGRGSFEAGSLGAFREEFESRGVPVRRIYLDMIGQEPQGRTRRLKAWTDAGAGSGYQLWSSDEILVNGMAQRLEHLFEAAATRHKERVEAEAARAADRERETATTTTQKRSEEPQGSVRRLLSHSWTITIVGGAIATFIAGVVVALLT